jgi:aerotolerance regulator-like protein
MTTLAAITLAASAFALGLGLIVLPIVAHLLHRRTRRRFVFPSVELLAATSASQSSVFRLRRWWLLLLRCLAVLAIVLAFMRPMWLSAEAQQAAGRGAAVVIILDASASTGQLHDGV